MGPRGLLSSPAFLGRLVPIFQALTCGQVSVPGNGKASFREPEAGKVGWTWAGEVLGY